MDLLLSARLFLLALSLVAIRPTRAQVWEPDWVLGPPESSSAYPFVEPVSYTGDSAQVGIRELIPVDQNSPTLLLRFNGSTLPGTSPECPIFQMKAELEGASLTLVTNLDYESVNKVYVCVFSLPGNPAPTFRVLTILVKDDNDNYPLWIESVSELTPFGENKVGMVYEFQASDADAGDNATLQFSFQTVIGNGSHFEMRSGGTTSLKTGQLWVIRELDYEAENFYLFSVTVADREGEGLTNTIQVTLRVLDAKDMNPVWTQESPFVTIDEELPINSTVFSVAARDGDVTFDDDIIYTLSDDKDSFWIEEETGVVRIKNRIDRDVADFDPYFDLVITATCLNYPENWSSTTSSVFIGDLNDNVPSFDAPVYDYYVDENFVGRLYDKDIQVSDPDLKEFGSYVVEIQGQPSQTAYLQLNPPGGNGRNDASFFISITGKDLLDYEDPSKRNVTVTLVATENVGKNRTAIATANIWSRDVNDNPPVFLETGPDGSYVVTILENSVPLTPAFKVSATDADVSPEFGTDSIRFSFVENFEAGRYFKLDNVSGQIVVAEGAVIDREAIGADSLTYTLQAADLFGMTYDNANVGLRTYARLIVNIQDVNDDTPRFSPLSVTTVEVSEGEAKDFVVLADIAAQDRDTAPELEFSIDWDKSRFEKERRPLATLDEWKKTFTFVVTNRPDANNAIGSILVSESNIPPCPTCSCEVDCPSSPMALDRETFDTVFLVLTVKDNRTELNTAKDEVTLTISIVDVNDNDPVFDPLTGDGSFTVVENNNSTKENDLGYVRAVDPDQDNIITYTATCVTCKESNESCKDDDVDYVAVDPNDGHLTMTRLIDYEEIRLIKCDVMATDSGDPNSRNAILQVEVNVVDVNDNFPVFVTSIPESLPIYEHPYSANGELVIQLNATDADSGEFGLVRYLFASNNVEGEDEFAIDLVTGAMTIKDSALLDFEKKRTYRFAVQARDNYRPNILSGSNWVDLVLNITLLDVNDNAPLLPEQTGPCYESFSESTKKDQLVATIQGVDADEPNTPNSWMEFILVDQVRLDEFESGPLCPIDLPLFYVQTDADKKTGRVLAAEDLMDCWGRYNVTVRAQDQGGEDPLGAQSSELTTYTLCVTNINHPPVFSFPSPDGTTAIKVYDNSEVGYPLFHDDGIRTQIVAEDKDYGDNAVLTYTWKNATVNEIFLLNSESGYITLNRELDRSEQSSYDLVVVATDHGDPPLKAETNLRINVRLSNKQNPVFPGDGGSETVDFTENAEMEVRAFSQAADLDNANLYPGEEPYPVCYYVTCGNTEYFEVPDPTLNQVRTKKPLDREDPPPVLYVVVEAVNNCSLPDYSTESCSEIDTTKRQYRNVSVNILDVYDCPPTFGQPLSGGITAGDLKETRKTIFTMTVEDEDLIDEATCSFYGKPNSSDVSLDGIETPFSIKNPTHEIILEFDVSSTMTGFFTMNVTCSDKGKPEANENWTLIKIFVVLLEHKVTFTFINDAATVDSERNTIAEIFTDVYGYRCDIESVSPGPSDPETGGPTAYVLSHFIDEDLDEPVQSSVIETIKNEGNNSLEVKQRLAKEGLILSTVSAASNGTDEPQELFMILFIVSCVFLLLLVALVAYLVYRGSELNRRVKALSSTDSASKETSDWSKGKTVPVPNTNKHTAQGSNPVWSVEGKEEEEDQFGDNASESSGDSILIGVEDNPEFNQTRRDDGQVIRRNPLAGLETPPPLPRSPPPVLDIQHDNVEESNEYDDDAIINSNFSFGASKMTPM